MSLKIFSIILFENFLEVKNINVLTSITHMHYVYMVNLSAITGYYSQGPDLSSCICLTDNQSFYSIKPKLTLIQILLQ